MSEIIGRIVALLICGAIGGLLGYAIVRMAGLLLARLKAAPEYELEHTLTFNTAVLYGDGRGSADTGSGTGSGGSDAGRSAGTCSAAGNAGTHPGLTVEKRTSEIIAWRGWTLAVEDGLPLLRSCAVAVAWPSPLYVTGKPVLQAELYDPHLYMWQIPTGMKPEDCRRGLHAVKTPDFLPSDYYERLPVIGEVALSGRVIEHEHGYRAERMMIRRLYVHADNTRAALEDLGFMDLSPLDLVEMLAERYQCDVELSAWAPLSEIIR